jgi:hypothetical protein
MRSFLSRRIDQVQVARIGNRHLEGAVVGGQRHEVVAEHQLNRNLVEEIVVDVRFAEVDEAAPVARRQRLSALFLGFGIRRN